MNKLWTAFNKSRETYSVRKSSLKTSVYKDKRTAANQTQDIIVIYYIAKNYYTNSLLLHRARILPFL